MSKSFSQSPNPTGTDGNGVQPAVVPVTESSNQVCNIHILDVVYIAHVRLFSLPPLVLLWFKLMKHQGYVM